MRLTARWSAALSEAVRIAKESGRLSPLAERDVEAALRALGPLPARASHRAEKRSEARARAGETSEIYRAVEHRAQGRCESCGRTFTRADPPQMDHFEGRRKGQSPETCWMLDLTCHRQKTENRPSAAYWLGAFIAHAERHGYEGAAERARRRLDFVRAREELSSKR